jgi:hypothetical protein
MFRPFEAQDKSHGTGGTRVFHIDGPRRRGTFRTGSRSKRGAAGLTALPRFGQLAIPLRATPDTRGSG